MSVKIMSLVWERAPYSSGSLLVLLALADWSNEEGISWPSMETLATKTRIERRSAQRIVRQLASDGYIKIEEGGGRGKQHRYIIQTEKMTNCRPLCELQTATPTSPFSEEKGDISNTKRATFDAQRATFEAETVTPTSPDPLEEPSEEPPREPSAHAFLLAHHANRIGKIPDGAAQAGAVKWILDAGFSVEQATGCYNFQLTEEWRKGNVSWLTVKTRIGSWCASQPKERPKQDRAAWEEEQRRKQGWDKIDRLSA